MAIIIDQTLTPENATQIGYEWIQDVIYDPEAPAGVMSEIEELVESGHKLGQPASSAQNFVGLYAKFKNIE